MKIIELINKINETISIKFDIETHGFVKTYEREKNTYPAIYLENKYIEPIIPDTSKKSISFFTLNKTEVKNINDFRISVISFYWWGNLAVIDANSKIDFSYELSEKIVEVLRFYGAFDFSIYYENVFDKWNFWETDRQITMLPFAAFKIDMKIMHECDYSNI